jgi:hypothetical protein
VTTNCTFSAGFTFVLMIDRGSPAGDIVGSILGVSE